MQHAATDEWSGPVVPRHQPAGQLREKHRQTDADETTVHTEAGNS